MINILLESVFDIDAPWMSNELKNYIKPCHSVAVVAFSFRDNRVKCLSDWDSLYGKEQGSFYHGIVDRFTSYGIQEENVSFINYFADTKESATQKVKTSDIIYFLGGLPDKMLDRIAEFDLYDTLMQHEGIIMGDSAGQLFNLQNTIWHLTGIIPCSIIIKAFHILMISIYKFTTRILLYKTKQFNVFLLNEVKEYMPPHLKRCDTCR